MRCRALFTIDVAGLINDAVGRQGGSTAPSASKGGRDASSAATSPADATGPATPARPASGARGRRSASAASEPATPGPEPAERFAEAVESIERAGSVQPLPEPSVHIPARLSLEDAAARVAEALDQVPGIGRYAEMPLSDLAERGPRAARRLWDGLPKRARDRLGSETIAAILRRRQGPTR